MSGKIKMLRRATKICVHWEIDKKKYRRLADNQLINHYFGMLLFQYLNETISIKSQSNK